MNPDEAILDKYLSSNEKLLWVGKPKQGLLLSAGHYFILFVGAAMFIVPLNLFIEFVRNTSFSITSEMPMLVGPLIGFLLYWYVLIQLPRIRLTTIYGLTNKRVLILIGGKKFYFTDIKSSEVQYEQKRDLSGTITFGQNIKNQIDYPFRFEYISAVQSVYSKFIHIKNDSMTIIGDVFNIDNLSGNFFNKTTLNDSFNNASSSGFNEEAWKELLSIAKRIEETENLAAGALLDKFNAEIKKPEAQQNKSSIKQFWEGLFKVMPDVAKIGKTIAETIALF